MKFNDLKVSKHRRTNRVGRGIAAGQGKTAGRGTKGQGARKSGGVRPGFEGGQNPLYMRLPKLRGFHAVRAKAENVYTGELNQFTGNVDNFTIADAGLTSSPYVRVKLILKGEVTKQVSVKLQGASANAVVAVQKAGGKFDKTPQVKRTAKETETEEKK